MLYVFNKNKILSYMVASFIVIGLFTFSTGVIPNKEIEISTYSSREEFKETIDIKTAIECFNKPYLW